MAIGFGRVEFIKRSEGRNSCQLSAYLARSRVYFEGNCALEPRQYDFSHRENVSHHEIILPEGADENLNIPEVLWNLAERKEVRKDAQVSMHLVLALPDDKEITLEDRIELTRTFIQKHYQGLVAECVIHPPERKIEFVEENEALGIPKRTIGTVMEEKEGSYIVSLPTGVRANPYVEVGVKCPGIAVQEHNWHAHAQLTTRRLKDNGKDLEDKKALDLMPVVKKGKVVSGPDVGKLWARHQNEFFLSKGLALRVDDNGLVPQEHLGPVRMRGRAFALLNEHEKRLELNEIASSDPINILNAITKRQSVFSKDDVERFMLKHVPSDKIQEVREGFWKLEGLVQLRSLETQEFVSKFSTREVIEEEEQILRLAGRIYRNETKKVPEPIQDRCSQGLSKEQEKAYLNVLNGKGLSCIQGYAGTGKSYLLKALKDAYEERGLIVRSFGPDNATAKVLQGKGFSSSENIYRFLFSHKHGLRNLHKGFEVWVLDEAGKLGNKPLLEFLKLAETKGAKVILAGDNSQLPPVERGGVFKTFCENYGSEVLEDIQRQKQDTAREMAKNLAKGEIGLALDKLVSMGSLSWSLTRKEAIESLVLKWAADHQHQDSGRVLGTDFSLVIASTNSEVRVLNEMIRLVRKGRGEISDREFACQTAHGKIYVSEGDRIEFRQKDQELGVCNGTSGVLIKAEKDRFSVAIQEGGKKTRIVSFNPQEYHKYQLGYAVTNYRAQGQTIQKGYVLHSPYLNKQMAYVGLTRHIESVDYFIAKEDAANLSDLKRHALRDGSKSTTLYYTNTREVEWHLAQKDRSKKIDELKESDQFTERLKGGALKLWDRFNQATYKYIEKKYDRKPSKDFFDVKEDMRNTVQAEVREVSKEEIRQLSIMPGDAAEKIAPQEVVEKIAQQDHALAIKQEGIKMENTAKEIEKDLYEKETDPSNTTQSLEKRPSSWQSLPKEERKLLSAYFSAASKASELREVVKAECGEDLRTASESAHYQAWQKACGKRNAAAHELKPLLAKEESKGAIRAQSAYYIEQHAQKHESILKAQAEKSLRTSSMKDLEGQLSLQVEPLLYKLFPDGPSSKTAKQFRFGAKGSLSVTHSGSKAGQFYDFERQEGGGLLKLISRELKLDTQEAKSWAGEFLGIASDITPPTSFKKPEVSYQKESDWVSIKPDTKVPAPKFEEQGKLSYYYDEVTRHPYHDAEGNLLYYVTRLQDKKDPSRKITPPLSYGYFKDNPEQCSWERRGYQDENGKRPLYNLHQLKEKPLAPVLIVEGEKTADKALEKIPDRDLICMTWSGGASSVSKADWSPLFGREVVVWPDNDEAGFKAAEQVCEELKKVCVSKVCMVERPELFARLPEKWDLADPLPKDVRASSLSYRLMDNQKDRLQEEVYSRLGLDKAPVAKKLKVANLLYHFEQSTKDKMAEMLNQDIHSRKKDELWRLYGVEGAKFIKQAGDVREMITSDPRLSASGKLAERLTYQVQLYEAKNKMLPNESQVLVMKETIECRTKDLDFIKNQPASEDIKELAIDRGLEMACEKALKGHTTLTENKQGFEKSVQAGIVELSKQEELAMVQTQELEKQQALAKDRSRGLSR